MLTALLDPEQRLADLNAMIGGSEMNERQFLDDVCGVESSSLPYEQLKPWLRAIRLAASEGVLAPYFVKTHDRFDFLADGRPLFPAETSLLAIHIVRHPCDVAISLAAHESSDIDRAIAKMADKGNMLNAAEHKGNEFLPVMIGDWGGHTLSWFDQTEIPALLIRYEDMIADPANALVRVAEATGLRHDSASIAAAIAATGFERLRAAEGESGFTEKPAGMTSFFRSGTAGGWRDLLNQRQTQSIESTHAVAMQRLGYTI